MPCCSHLSSDERTEIGLLVLARYSISTIARALGRSKSTISRELKRNRLPRGGYSPCHSDGAYMARRQHASVLERDVALGRTQQFWRYLTRRRKSRRPMRARRSRNTLKDRASIHYRPDGVESRGEAGHWEGDLILCRRTRPVLVLHERKSRLTLAARLTGKTAAETAAVLMSVFRRLDPELRKSITFDYDTSFARHAMLRSMFNMTTWFCDAYASWQKGGVENANGRLRRWLPRHLDIDALDDEDLQENILTANHLTPRKCLGYKTPIQAMLADLGRDVRIRFA